MLNATAGVEPADAGGAARMQLGIFASLASDPGQLQSNIPPLCSLQQHTHALHLAPLDGNSDILLGCDTLPDTDQLAFGQYGMRLAL